MLKVERSIDYLKKGKSGSEASEEVQRVKQIISRRKVLRFKRSDDNLGLPENFKVGKAIADGNCFFDSFRQGLEQQLGIKVTVAQLRQYCKEFAQNNPPEWFINAIANSHDNNGVVRKETPDSYIVNILSNNRWGDSEVEARILCEKYRVKLHVVEKHAVEEKEVWIDQIVSSEGSRSIDSINYNEENTIHIINRGNAHFEPILSTQEIQHNKQQSPDPSDYDDEITPEEELFSTIKSNDLEEEKLAKIKRLFEKERKPEINFQDINLDTVLHIAVRREELKVIQLLIEKGAKINDDSVKNKRKRTPLDVAKHFKKQDILNVFEARSLSQPFNQQTRELSSNIDERRTSYSTYRYIEKEPQFHKERNLWRVDVPKDSNCLFLAFILAYLVPVKDKDQDFRNRFENLSGKDHDVSEEKFNQVKNLVRNYNPFLNMENTYANEALKLLTESFRNLVINHIHSKKNIKNYIMAHTKNSLEDYLSKVRNPSIWGSDLEIKAISDLLNCNIYSFPTGKQGVNYNPNGNPSIKLVFDINSIGKNKGDKHYNFCLNGDIGKNFEVYGKLSGFVKTFVKQFQAKLQDDYNQVKPGGKTKIEDQKAVGILGQIIGGAISLKAGYGLSGVSAGKEIFSSAGGYFANKKARELAKKINDLFQPFWNNKGKFEEMLVNVGAEIFRNFENQFTKYTAGGGWQRAMDKLAGDAIKRVVNYVDSEFNNPSDGTEIMKINDFYTIITIGIILGKSEESYTSKITTPFRKVKVPFMSGPGKTLKVVGKGSDEEHKTADVYEKTGLLKKEKGVNKYYKKIDVDIDKYGYRLPFEWELEKGEGWVKEHYKLDSTPRRKYNYIIKLGDELERRLKDILDELDRNNLEQVPGKVTDLVKGQARIEEKQEEGQQILKRVEKKQEENLGLTKDTLKVSEGVEVKLEEIIQNQKKLDDRMLKLSIELNSLSKSKLEAINLRTDDKDKIDQKVTKLHDAVSADNEESVKVLLEEKVEVNAKTVSNLITPLHIAAENGSKKIIDDLLNAENIDVNAKTQQGATPLHYAAKSGHREIVEALLNKGAEVNVRMSDDGFTLLHYAAESGYEKVVNVLLKREDVNINEINNQGATALHIAAANGHKGVVEHLLARKGIAVDVQTTKDKCTPLYYAAQNGFNEVVKALLDKNDKVINTKNFEGNTPLHVAVYHNHVDVVETLLDKGASVNEINNLGATPLHYAAQNNFIASVEALLKVDNIDVNVKTKQEGATSLHYAAENDYEEVVKALLNKGADINIQTADQKLTPLHIAARANHKGVVELLLNKGADIDVQTIHGGFTPLHIAARLNNIEVVKVLLSRGASVDLRSARNNTPLDLAVQSGHIDVVKALLDKSANVDAYNGDQDATSLHAAAEGGHKEIVEVLSRKGADINIQTADQKLTPLHIAAAFDKREVIDALLKMDGIRINEVDNNGATSLHYAARKGCLEVVKALLSKGAYFNAKTNQDATPLDYAELHDHSIVIKVLSSTQGLFNGVKDNNLKEIQNYLNEGAIVNAKDNSGWAPLHYSIDKDKNVVELLLKNGADATQVTNDKKNTALHLATSKGNKEFVKILIEHIKQTNPNKLSDFINTRTAGGTTSLHIAAKNNNKEIVDLLLENHADFSIKNKNEKAPLDLATNQDIIDLLRLRSQQQEAESSHQEGLLDSTSLEKCLPGPSSGSSTRRKREAKDECLFTWEDVDVFNTEQDKKRDFDKTSIDSKKFVNYIKDLSEEKRSQLIQLADKVKVTGEFQSSVNKLTNNQKVMNHLNRVEKISGMTMHGMMAKNVLADFLNGDYQGIAINVGFIAGGQGFAKVAEAASLKGLKLAAEGKLLLGKSLRAASPFLARGTSAFVVYDLVNQVKAFKNGTEEALVGVVGDSIYLGVDAAEIGIEVAEAFEVLEGVSSVTGPIGAAVGAVVFVGTDVYMAVKRVDKIDQIIHLTGKEKFIEGLRAFIGMQPEKYIQELLQEKEVSNELVRQGLEYLSGHSDVQKYVFPTKKIVCHQVINNKTVCVVPGTYDGMCIKYGVKTFYTEECTPVIEMDSRVIFDRKRTDIKWSRAKPDDPNGGQLFCLPQGDYKPVPNDGSYLCENAIGITDLSAKTGNHTLISLGEGEDYAEGFVDSPNIFVVNNGSKIYYGGDKDDIFILQGNLIKGSLYGEGGIDTLDLTEFAQNAVSVDVYLNTNIGDIIYGRSVLRMGEMERVLGRKAKSERIFSTCDTQFLDGQGSAENSSDTIIISNNDCTYNMQIIVRPNTNVYNNAHNGNFNYTVLPGKGKAQINLSSLLNDASANRHNFFFNYTISELVGINVQNISQVFNYTVKSATFSFLPTVNKSEGALDSKFEERFNITISDIPANASYVVSNGAEIKMGSKGNLYMLENTNKSVDEIIRDYLVVANRLNRMSFFIQSVLSNETVAIGSGNYEVIHNNPLQKSHLVGNGGENVYVIDSKRFEIPLPEVVIYDLDVESSVDTIDLRSLVQQARGKFSNSFKLQVLKSANDLLLKATVERPTGDSSISEKHEYFTVRLKDGVSWYNKTHVIMDNVPMRISLDNNEWSLKPQPLMFEKDKEVIVVTSQDVEENTELITPKKAGNYTFVRDHGSDLMITNAFNTQDDLCTIVLSKFYETPKMETLSIKFADKEIALKDKQEEINTARDVDIVKREHKEQVYSDVFNRSPEVMLSDQPHRHQVRHRRSTSGSARTSLWINDLFGWVKSSISGLLSSKPEVVSSTKSPISQVDAKMDVNGTIMLLDVIVRKFTGKQYIPTVNQSIPLLEARGYALNITNRFEKVLNKTAIKSGISVTNLNFDPVAVQSAIIGKIINGRFSEIAKILYSFAKEACPEFKQTDKFLDHLRSNLKEEKETVLLQQKVEKPSKVLDQEVSRKVELSKKPDTFLNGTSVVRGISRGIN